MRLLESADTSEKLKIYLGWFFAALTGAILPTFFFFIGPIFDSFSDGADLAKEKVRELCMIMGILALGITLTSFFQNYLLMTAAAGVAAKMKTKYLKAVLNQESAWFDQCNYMELSSRMTREISQI